MNAERGPGTEAEGPGPGMMGRFDSFLFLPVVSHAATADVPMKGAY